MAIPVHSRLKFWILLLMGMSGTAFIFAQPIGTDKFPEDRLTVVFYIDGTEIVGGVTLNVECSKNGELGSKATINRPILLFPGKEGEIRVSFSNFEFPKPSTSGINYDELVFAFSKSKIQVEEGTRIRRVWIERILEQGAKKGQNAIFEFQEGGSTNIKIPYELKNFTSGKVYGTGSVDLEYSIQLQEEQYAYLQDKRDTWQNPSYIRKCEKYLEYFPSIDGRTQEIEEILLFIDNTLWTKCNKSRAKDLYSNYLQLLSNPFRKTEAETLLHELQQEAWETARLANTIIGYDAYLKDFDGIRFGDIPSNSRQAKSKIVEIDEIEWMAAKSRNTESAYRKYLDLFIDTNFKPKHWKEADSRIKNLPSQTNTPVPTKEEDPEPKAWQYAYAVNTMESYQRYLERFPDGSHKDEAEQQIFLLQPIISEYLIDSTDIFHYTLIVRNSMVPRIDTIIPSTGVELEIFQHDSLTSTLEIFIHDRVKHLFFLVDSLGKRDTFEIDVSIDPITAKANRLGDDLVFEISGGIPPYYIQFELLNQDNESWLSGLYLLGDSTQTTNEKTYRIPIGNLGPEIEAGQYTLLVKDSRQTESFPIPSNFEIDRPKKLSLWVFLIGPLIFLLGFLTYRNVGEE